MQHQQRDSGGLENGGANAGALHDGAWLARTALQQLCTPKMMQLSAGNDNLPPHCCTEQVPRFTGCSFSWAAPKAFPVHDLKAWMQVGLCVGLHLLRGQVGAAQRVSQQQLSESDCCRSVARLAD